MYDWRAPLRLFFSNEGIHANLSREKPFLFCVNEEIYIRFRKFSERTNVEWNFIFFTFASQCKLCGLLSYGEYSNLFISVVCFLKTTHLSVHRFSCRIKSTHIIFLLLKNTDHSNRVLSFWKIYIWINFSLRNPCHEIDYERAQNWKIARSLCAKVLLRTSLCNNQTSWEMKIINPPSNFACS